jgi:hypothetical protein
MGLIECGHCGWTHEVDDELPIEQLEAAAAKLYARHLLEDHPTLVRLDEIVQKYLREAARRLSPTNGAPT